MVLLQITALLIIILYISYRTGEKTVDTIPVAVCILTLLLYILSFFNALSFSDVISAAVVAAAGISLFRSSSQSKKAAAVFLKESLLNPGTLTAVIMVAAVTILVSGKIVTWWDDYNFWATDAKAIYYLNGFADKFQNVAPEFGDYPPGTQMMKWWFLHFSPNQFREGLLFAGYYCMNLAFLFPLLKFIKKRNPLLMILCGAAIFLFPTVAEVFWCDGACADLTMAVIYGAFLAAVIDREGHGNVFYYGRQALYLMVLVLCKNVGFMWAAFGLMFAFGYHLLILFKQTGNSAERKVMRKGLLLITALPVITELSWLTFCLINKRVAKLTGAAIQMAAGSMNIPDYSGKMTKAFVEAFVKWPLHRWKTLAIDLSPLALFILLLLLVFLLYRFKRIQKSQAWLIGSFFAVSGIFFYTLNLISHLTIFAAEAQYLEPYGMISSIERYGAPFTIGSLYLTAFLCMNENKHAKQGKIEKGIIICLVFVFLTADYGSAWRAVAGYRNTVRDELQRREELVDANAQKFLTAVGAERHKSIGRVLYLRDISDVSWVRNTYVGFEAAPVSVMYGNVDTKSMNEAAIKKTIEDSHAGYLYVDPLSGDGQALFKTLTGGELLQYETLYKIADTKGTMILQKYKEG